MTERIYGKWQRVRISIVFSAFLLGAAILAAHLFFLQFHKETREYYRARVEERWHSFECPQGKRGEICFRDGSLLAGNRKVARVLVEPSLIRDLPAVCASLGPLIGAVPAELQERVERDQRAGLVVAEGVPLETALAVDKARLRGVFTRYYYERIYPQGDRGAAATIGYAGKEPVHRLGLECSFNKQLSGQTGKVVYRKDANRKRLPGSVLEEVPKHDGQPLVTSLDEAVQTICEDELRRGIAASGAKWGCVIVMDPANGEVLGAATEPAYDPNKYVAGHVGIETNIISQHVFEPGSTAKPILAAYALDKNWLDPKQRFVCNQALNIDGHTVREAELSHVLGGSAGEPIKEIISHSSNIGMARVALMLGQDRVYQAYSSMGLFRRTGIELPMEAKGFKPCHFEQLKSKKKIHWPRISVATTGFGQGLAVTPLQLAQAYCIIANGGYLVRPTLLLGGNKPKAAPQEAAPCALPDGEVLVADDGSSGTAEQLSRLLGTNPAQAAEPDGSGRVRVLSAETCRTVTDWLSDAVINGTAKRAKLERFDAAGKTGTAQVPSPRGGYQKGAYTASFAGFFPAKSPRYVVVVVIGYPRGYYYGGLVAAPIFKAVGDRISYIDQLVFTGENNAP